MTFRDRVLQVVATIPRGSVMTYRQVAVAAGSPRAARAVGTIMKQNFRGDIPCHRVIRSDGTPGEYNRGAVQKVARLREEGALR